MPDNQTTKTSYRWLIILVTSAVFIITLLIFYGAGQKSGVEFSPDDFSRRAFSYNQTPFVKWVIHRKSYADRTTSMEKNLIQSGFIQTVVNRTKTWHLIKDSGSNSAFASDQCDARFLTNYLDLSNEDGDEYWTIWSTDFPKCAKVFWPLVAELARDEMYLKIPDVMQFAMELNQDKPKRFEDSLQQIIANAYLELGEIDLELDRLERAKSRLQKASDRGDSKTSKRADEKLADCKSKLNLRPVAADKSDADEGTQSANASESSDE